MRARFLSGHQAGCGIPAGALAAGIGAGERAVASMTASRGSFWVGVNLAFAETNGGIRGVERLLGGSSQRAIGSTALSARARYACWDAPYNAQFRRNRKRIARFSIGRLHCSSHSVTLTYAAELRLRTSREPRLRSLQSLSTLRSRRMGIRHTATTARSFVWQECP